MKQVKITEGVGYLSGDYECFCIHSIPPRVWAEMEDKPEGSYPDDWFPQGFEDKKVRYRIQIEVEEV